MEDDPTRRMDWEADDDATRRMPDSRQQEQGGGYGEDPEGPGPPYDDEDGSRTKWIIGALLAVIAGLVIGVILIGGSDDKSDTTTVPTLTQTITQTQTQTQTTPPVTQTVTQTHDETVTETVTVPPPGP
jgi:hypothetical protein